MRQPPEAPTEVRVKRIYQPPDPSDGVRILVDRLWPRGVTRQAARLDTWAKELAPSDALRRWFDHRPERFTAFRDRYLEELSARREEAEHHLLSAEGAPLTLLTATRDPRINHAVVLADYLRSL